MANPMIDDNAAPYLNVPAERIGRHTGAFHTPAQARIGTVTLQVADLARSLAFYQGVIGYRLLPAPAGSPAGNRAYLGASGDERVLLVLVEKPGVRPAPLRARLGLYHTAVLLPSRADLGRFLRHALALGVHVGSSDHFYSEALYLVDPDGLSVEVYRDRPRAEWVVSTDGELLGTADPLKKEEVLAAGGDQAWEGLPAGTTIGHLHFYVGDIDQALAFYGAGLGLAQTFWRFPTGSFVSAGGYHHHIGMNTWAAGSPASTADDARLLTWEGLLPDAASLEATVESLRRAGFASTADGEAYVANDPWGITVRLVVRPGTDITHRR
jgi:catechol 2,3-dioxygenase